MPLAAGSKVTLGDVKPVDDLKLARPRGFEPQAIEAWLLRFAKLRPER
jgi:hypothetical protein